MHGLVRAARGEGTVDLALLNASVFNPFLCEWEETALGIKGGRVLGPGVYRARRELDLGGARVVPGLIDPHVHIESSLLSPFEYARLAAVHGTTTVVADPHGSRTCSACRGSRTCSRAGPTCRLTCS